MNDIIQKGREIAESYNCNGKGFDNTGKKNAYVCEKCGSYIITIDRHPGVTPFMVRCGACDSMAQSKMYRVQDYLNPTHEWYRPDTLDGINSASFDHIENGGLILRAIPGKPDTWNSPEMKSSQLHGRQG